MLCLQSGYNIQKIESKDLGIVNNSRDSICFSITFMYPDTSIVEYNPLNDPSNHLVKPFSSKEITGRNSIRYSFWEKIFSYNNKAYLFIFNYDTLVNNNWIDVRKKYKIENRIELSKIYLDSINWTVIYSPSETKSD